MSKTSAWLLALLSAACASDPLASCPEEGIAQEAFSRKCLSQSLDPVTDPSRADYGRVDCVMIVAESAGTPACNCDGLGRAPASALQAQRAREIMSASGMCPSTCCDEICFCEYVQLSGELLAACQSRPNQAEYNPLSAPLGWCYVEPALGLGDDETVDTCPPTQKRNIRYFPDEPRQNLTAALMCVGAPG